MTRWRQRTRATPRDHLELLAVRTFVAFLSLPPHRLSLAIGGGLGRLAHALGIRREVARDNVRLARDLAADEGEVRAIVRDAYAGVGRAFAEYARLPRTPMPKLRERVTIEGREHLEAALAPGRGALAMSGHFGSLELVATAFRAWGFRTTMLVAPMRNPLVHRFLREHRSYHGVDLVEVGPNLRAAFGVLRAGGLLCVAADQDAGRHGIFVDFLGRPASTATGTIELARRTGAPIVFGLIEHQGGGRHVVRVRPPLVVPKEGEAGEVVRHSAEILAGWLEEGVRAKPDHWFWLHRRWKTRPPAREAPTAAGDAL